MGAALAGVEGIRIWHDQALIKPPHGNPTAWHLDVPYWSFDSRKAISCWVALDDATLANGCMWYIPGSHLTARFENCGIGQNIGELFTIYPEWRNIEPQPVPCPAGSIVWHAPSMGAPLANVILRDLFNSLKIGDLLTMKTRTPSSGTIHGKSRVC